MGNGKTKMAIDYANGINAKRVLIICPKKVIGVWPHQFQKHSYNNFNCVPLEKGSVAKRAEKVKQILKHTKSSNHPIAIILNYESYWRPPLGPVYDKFKLVSKGILTSVFWDLLIMDEAHRIKSPGGQASWAALRISKVARHKLWLSGTPMPHSPVDLYAQMRALNSKIFGTRLKAFKDEYCVLGGFDGRQVVAYKNVDELNKKFFSIARYVSTEDAHDLPPKQDININFDLCSKAQKAYNEFNKELITEIKGKEISADNILVKLLRLAQLTGGFVKFDDDTEQIVDGNKIDTTVELIKDLPEKEPIVIFVRFRNELERLTQAIQKKTNRKIAEISGRFKNLPSDFSDGIWHATDHNILLNQIQSGAEGIDLTIARYCFFMSIGYSLGQYRQARRRLWRPGQVKKVFYYHILANHTVDVQIAYAIKRKKQIVDSIIEGITGKTTIASIQSQAIDDAMQIFGINK
jgi:SNF2 family DNA or RNA helicase